MFKDYYTKYTSQIPVDYHLQNKLASNLFTTKPQPVHRLKFISNYIQQLSLMKKSLLYTSSIGLAGLTAVIGLASIFPHHYALAKEVVDSSLQVVINAVFDPAKHQFNDDAIEAMQQDPNINSLEYTRNENNEVLKVEGTLPDNCDPEIATPDCLGNVLPTDGKALGGTSVPAVGIVGSDGTTYHAVHCSGDLTNCETEGIDFDVNPQVSGDAEVMEFSPEAEASTVTDIQQ
jgi:hypothetical protein